MKVYVNVKQAGKRKNYITKQEINLNSKPNTLRQLIAEIIVDNVKNFNDKTGDQRIVNYLTSEEINDKLTVGKVSFKEMYNLNEADINKALEIAFLAYEDGIFRIFNGENEAGKLDESLELREGDILTFIRLTMLSGRLW